MFSEMFSPPCSNCSQMLRLECNNSSGSKSLLLRLALSTSWISSHLMILKWFYHSLANSYCIINWCQRVLILSVSCVSLRSWTWDFNCLSSWEFRTRTSGRLYYACYLHRSLISSTLGKKMWYFVMSPTGDINESLRWINLGGRLEILAFEMFLV